MRKRLHNPLFALFIVATLTVAFLINCPITVQAAPTASESIDVKVDHAVQIRNGGLIIINDTISLSAETDQNIMLSSFPLGFPHIYEQNLDYVYAYDSSDTSLNISLDVGLGRIGFYGVEVELDVKNSRNYEFTVVFVFSNLISSQVLPFTEPETGKSAALYNATFPAYPSLTQTVSLVNLTITLQSDVEYVKSSFDEKHINFTNRMLGAVQVFNHTGENLNPFAYEPSWFEFAGLVESLLVIEAKEIRRDITVDSWRHVLISDSYEIIPEAGNLSELKIQLRRDVMEVSAWDEFGNLFEKENLKIEQGNATALTNATLTFSPPHIQDESARFRLTYKVPWESIINQSDWQTHRIALTSFESFNWIVRKLVVTVALPEGAEFTRPPDLGVVQKSVFQETLTFVYYNVTPFQNLHQEATYEYTIFWASFRPSLWVGTAVTILGVLALLWRAPRPAAPIPTIPVRPEELRSYVSAYEQKRRNLSQIETLDESARKRKIPRRRYKVRKRTLESRLSVLSKDLARLREKLQTASPKYADMMRQIEIAEAELEGIEAGIRRTETRYRRGEISTAAYHKLLEGYYRRRERARTTIDGVLLRLREEIA